MFSSIGLFNSIINICTDFLFALIPIPIIYKLQVNQRTKITLGFILSLGLVACASAIVKAHLQTTFLSNPDRYWDDGFMVWNMIELCLGIIAASLPSLKPLFKSVLESTRTALGLSGSRSKNSSGYRRHGSAKDIDDSFQARGIEFKDMKSAGSTKVSKTDVEVTQEIEIDMIPIRAAEDGAFDDREFR